MTVQEDSLVEKHHQLLFLLNNLSPKKRNKLIKALKRQEIESICEIFANFLKRNIPVQPQIINGLQRYQNDIRSVARKKTPLYKKKLILTSRRGGAILAALLPLAVSLISSLIR